MKSIPNSSGKISYDYAEVFFQVVFMIYDIGIKIKLFDYKTCIGKTREGEQSM